MNELDQEDKQAGKWIGRIVATAVAAVLAGSAIFGVRYVFVRSGAAPATEPLPALQPVQVTNSYLFCYVLRNTNGVEVRTHVLNGERIDARALADATRLLLSKATNGGPAELTILNIIKLDQPQ